MHSAATELYLDLLKKVLVNLIYEDPPLRNLGEEPISESAPFTSVYSTFVRQKRLEGKDFPSSAYTMIGLRRPSHLQALVEDVLHKQIPGDLIETGSWRAGATILMRGILRAHGVTDRTVWVADSFAGFPSPTQEGMSRSFTSPEFQGMGAAMTQQPEAFKAFLEHLWKGSSYEEVKEGFARFGLLDDQVRFLRGWFHETLPSAPIQRLAVLRMDGDLYDSTYQALESLYPKLSVGGYAIVDDYAFFAECRQAVHDYLKASGLTADIQKIDDEAVFWKKAR